MMAAPAAGAAAATLIRWLMKYVGPLAIQALGAIGIGVVTMKGTDIAIDQLIQLLHRHIGGLPSDMLAIAGRAGLGTAMGIVLGGVSTIVSYKSAAAGMSFLGYIKKR